MTHRLIELGFPRLLATQFLVTVVMTSLLWWFADNTMAYSALLGGLVCIIPGAAFALQAFKYKGAQAAKKIMMRFYWGEALKLGLTFILFTLIFVFVPIDALPFFITFIATQMIYWFAPFILKT